MSPEATECCEPLDELKIVEPVDTGRDEVENYIREGFFRTHRANIQSFMPILLALHDDNGRVNAALGYRPGGGDRFFLERYLDQPVEVLISRASGEVVRRSDIVEIGNLACRNANRAAQLMWLLARHLMQRRYRWVVFTGTRAVRDILRIFPAAPIELSEAKEACAGHTGDAWGRYYRADPRVLAGFLPSAFHDAQS